jgi:hypothetical protein
MQRAVPKFNKLQAFLKNKQDAERNHQMAEKMSPQSENIPDIQPYEESEQINKKRQAIKNIKDDKRNLYQS